MVPRQIPHYEPIITTDVASEFIGTGVESQSQIALPVTSEASGQENQIPFGGLIEMQPPPVSINLTDDANSQN